MSIAITFWGAAGQVTGSCHLLEWNGRRVLLDCGLFQGHRVDAAQLNASEPFDPRQLDAVVLSHAHIDHSGRLPLLTARQFDKPIYATPATRDLCASMLPDAAHIQESDFHFLQKRGRAGKGSAPLYTMADAVHAVELMESHPYERPFTVAGDLTVTYRDAGHILGSANVEVQIAGATPHRLVFSGDVGRWGQPIIRDPSGPRGAIDTLIVESTYATRNHDTSTNATATPRRDRAPRRRAQGHHPGSVVCARAHPGIDLRAAPAGRCEGDSADPDLRRFAARRGGNRRLPDASGTLRRHRGADPDRLQALRLSPRDLRARRERIEAAQLAERSGDHCRGVGNGGERTDHPPPGEPLRGVAQLHSAGRDSRRRARWVAASRTARRTSASLASRTTSPPRLPRSTATRRMPAATNCAAGSRSSVARSVARSAFTASRSRLLGMQAILQEEGVKEVHVPKHGERFEL